MERHESAMDSSTGYERHTMQRHLADGRGRKISKARDASGREETHDELVNMDEGDTAQFDRDWHSEAPMHAQQHFFLGRGQNSNRSRLEDRSRHQRQHQRQRQPLSSGGDAYFQRPRSEAPLMHTDRNNNRISNRAYASTHRQKQFGDLD